MLRASLPHPSGPERNAWLFYREASWPRRLACFVGIMLLGNIAMALYVLILPFRLPPGAGAEQLLLRPGP